MRKILALVLGSLLLGLMGSAAAAPVAGTTAYTLRSDYSVLPDKTGVFAENVEWVGNVALSQDAVGGRVVGNYFYANDQNKIMIFDIKDPLNPTLTGFVPMPQEWEYSREDIDTNGKILIIPNTVGEKGANTFYVIDVEDKTNPRILASTTGGQHTQSCILDCTWAYGSDGAIHDLRDPSAPKLMEERWNDGLPGGNGHDVEEVAPGIVLTATQPIMMLDVRKDPRHPKLLAAGGNVDGRFIHSGRWPNGAKDKFLLMGGEKNTVARCADTPDRGAFMTWDASKWKKTHSFTMIDQYYAKNGTWTDGNPAANPGIGGCSSHWLEASPKFRNGGIVAAAFFGHGTRMFRVNSKGKISEAGYFIPIAGETGAIYWITDEIMYAVDYNRGIDILRYTGKH
ncbi:MAG TPA: hypothetical protein VJ927_12655 [Actinomycetota bacterium]|nr:hypothetical protein [Actinomycetota bacterium]